ncbi:hypothetical protein LF1_19900 [Rubripirellula obstinata]|uniref:Periplasmic folding chaperone n=1 Tax=Rubripirellula obstinata TaxID=406547 RepID=A0A5B1CE85_9BACT|nr:hypothetical protein [Rubripirellula obstinata]KAA1259457.1 hypothetical protein LF1_19900 [Rubripirellula obstinata]
MNYSPFEIFRRNLKPLMVFLTLLALMAFVVLPTMQSYMQNQAGGGGDAVVAKFAGGSLTQSRVDYFTRNHQSTVRFLAELAERTIALGGVPATPGFQYDAQKKQIQRLGINESPSTESTIRTFMFANEAAKEGFELDDASLSGWLESFTGGMISDSEITARLMKATGNQMGRPHLYEQLRNHLLADVYLRRGNASLMSTNGVLMTPDEQWRNFLKLNRSATVSAYGVLVNDYLDQTDKTPSDQRIREVFEEGKDRDPNEQSAEPAFHQQYAARFEYLVGDYRQFLDAEIAKLSEDQIKAEYERRIKGGDFQLPEDEEMEEEASEEEETETASEAEPAAKEMEAEETEAEETKTEETVEEAAEAAMDSETASEQPATEEPTAEEPAVEEPAVEEPAPVGDKDQSRASNAANAVRLVSAQADADDSSEKEPEGSDAKEEAETEEAETEEPAKSSGVETLEDVREQIAEDLAGPAAREALDKAVTKVNQAMRTYFSELAIHQSNLSVGQKSVEPTRPDLKGLAKELGMVFESIGPHSVTSIQKEPIAQSFEVGSQFGRRGPGFSLMMFGFSNGQNDINPQPLFAAVRTADDQKGKIYVSWKTDETQAKTPTLDEARDDVIMAIRMQEARELAKAEAQKIADAAAKSGDLAAEVPEDKKSNFYDGLGPFTWMNSFGFSGATIGNVPELDSVGNEFMAATFNTEEGNFSVAPNQPERVFYVVQPTKFEPAVEELQEQFKQPVNRMMARMVSTDINEVLSGYYDSVDEKAGFESFVEAE